MKITEELANDDIAMILENQIEAEKCTHLLPKSPSQIWINRSCFAKLCRDEYNFNEGFFYIFVPFEDEALNFFYAYVEIDKRYLEYLLKNNKNSRIDLVSNFKVLHIEPGRHVSLARRNEIKTFFNACRDLINYPQMAVA